MRIHFFNNINKITEDKIFLKSPISNLQRDDIIKVDNSYFKVDDVNNGNNPIIYGFHIKNTKYIEGYLKYKKEYNRLQNNIIDNLLLQIQNNKVVIFGDFQNCGYCKSAKEMILNNFDENLVFVYDLKINKNGDMVKQYLMNIDDVKKIYHRTIPLIFIDGKFIGGYDDLMKIINTLSI